MFNKSLTKSFTYHKMVDRRINLQLSSQTILIYYYYVCAKLNYLLLLLLLRILIVIMTGSFAISVVLTNYGGLTMWAYSVWYTSHITKPFAKSTLEGRNKKYSWQSFAIFWHKCFIRILCQQLYIQPSGLFVPRDSSPPGIFHISIPPPK